MIDLEGIREKMFEGLREIAILSLHQEPALPIIKPVERFELDDISFTVYCDGEEYTEENYFRSAKDFRKVTKRHDIIWTTNKSLAKKVSTEYNDERAEANGWN